MTTILWAHSIPIRRSDAWTMWSTDWVVVTLLVVSAVLYARGAAALAARARDATALGVVQRARTCYVAGWIILALALVSPLHAFGEVILSAHMVQHQLLVAAAAPLLVLGRPDIAFVHGLPRPWRRRALLRPVARTWRAMSIPIVATVVHGGALVAGHLPSVYQTTMHSSIVHALQHFGFFGTALLFWWAMFRAPGARRNYGASILLVFVVMVATGVVGAWLAWSRVLWYPAYVVCSPVWGMNPLEDQQVAGLIMWIPGGLAYLAAAIWLGLRWLQEADRRSVRHDAARRLVLRNARTAGMMLLAIALTACGDKPRRYVDDARVLTGGEPEIGERLIIEKGCGSCHSIPGIRGAHAKVGPNLDGIASRAYIGGVAENTPDNMVMWLMDPPRLAPNTAMPNLGLDAHQARNIAAYLYTLR